MPEPARPERVGHLTKGPLVLLSLNVIGAIAYVVVASHAWRIAEEQGVVPVTGEPFVWFAGIFPIVAIFSLLNLVWGSVLLARRQWQSGRLWLLTALAWIVAVLIDFAHH